MSSILSSNNIIQIVDLLIKRRSWLLHLKKKLYPFNIKNILPLSIAEDFIPIFRMIYTDSGIVMLPLVFFIV